MNPSYSLRLRNTWETLEGEQLKQLAEFSLHTLAKHEFGLRLLQAAQGGERIDDPRLYTPLGTMALENPLLVAAGWDKKGRAVDGLHALGFAGTEIGSVLVHPQAGNPRPRLWYHNGVGLNTQGFNGPGMEAVANNLDTQKRSGIIGISIGKNKLTPDNQAPWAHAAVAERLYDYGDYFVINVASPNTPGLRNLLNPEPLTDIVQAVQSVLTTKGRKSLFIKTTVDLALQDLDNVIGVCLDNDVTGIIDSNTTVDPQLKAQHGWSGKAGGISGNDTLFRQRANERMKHISRVTGGTALLRVGVGGVHDASSAIERLQAGAQALQVLTGIRQHKSRVAHDINQGILDHLDNHGIENVQELIGSGL